MMGALSMCSMCPVQERVTAAIETRLTCANSIALCESFTWESFRESGSTAAAVQGQGKGEGAPEKDCCASLDAQGKPPHALSLCASGRLHSLERQRWQLAMVLRLDHLSELCCRRLPLAQAEKKQAKQAEQAKEKRRLPAAKRRQQEFAAGRRRLCSRVPHAQEGQEGEDERGAPRLPTQHV